MQSFSLGLGCQSLWKADSRMTPAGHPPKHLARATTACKTNIFREACPIKCKPEDISKSDPEAGAWGHHGVQSRIFDEACHVKCNQEETSKADAKAWAWGNHGLQICIFDEVCWIKCNTKNLNNFSKLLTSTPVNHASPPWEQISKTLKACFCDQALQANAE